MLEIKDSNVDFHLNNDLISGENFERKKAGDAVRGKIQVELAKSQMKSLSEINNEYKESKPFSGIRIGICLHLTKETGFLVETLVNCGASVGIASCNPDTTVDDVVAYLSTLESVSIWGYRGESIDVYRSYLERVLLTKPNLVIDDGCELTAGLHTRFDYLLDHVLGGTEQTTAGINRVINMVNSKILKYPVIAVNDANTKSLIDNYYGTGQSTIDGILRCTNILITGKTIVVSGYGPCGKGIALRMKGMGASIIVTEIDHFRALQAFYDGHSVMTMEKACSLGDIFITVTGCSDVIGIRHIPNVKDGAIFANSGHFDVEINIKDLSQNTAEIQEIRPGLEKYIFPDKKYIYILSKGRLVNLSGAEGHPSEIMDSSFSGQFHALLYLLNEKNSLEPNLINTPKSVDKAISSTILKSKGIQIDSLLPHQIEYMSSWEIGT